jgi:hypothetical protein
MNRHHHYVEHSCVPVHDDALPSLIKLVCVLSKRILWSVVVLLVQVMDGCWLSHRALFNQPVLVGHGAGAVHWEL